MKTRSSIVLLVIAVSSLTTFTASGHPSSGIVVDQKGNVFFSNMSHGVLKIDPQGKVTTVSKEGGHWLALDTDGSFSKVDFLKSRTGRVGSSDARLMAHDRRSSPTEVRRWSWHRMAASTTFAVTSR
jgi:hypothetical protein